jgi:hypothetical protein
MMVRCETSELRRETDSALYGGTCSVASGTGTGANKKGTRPRQYGEGQRGESADRMTVVSADWQF